MSDVKEHLSTEEKIKVAQTEGEVVVHKTVLQERVENFETSMKEMPNQIDIPTQHYFSEGVYAREITIPKGTLLTGYIHKYRNLNIMSKGDMTVLTENGPVRIQAPYTVVSPPGTKRIAYAHEDCVWTTIHGTNETDIDKIENHFISSTYEEYVEFLKNEKDKLWHG